MTGRETTQWLKAYAQSFPKARLTGLKDHVDAMSVSGKPCRWEIGLSPKDPAAPLRLRCFGSGDYAAFAPPWRGKISAPPASFPWLEISWDPRAGKITGSRLHAAGLPCLKRPDQAAALGSDGAVTLLNPGRLSGALLRDPSLAPLLSAPFAIKDIVTEWEIVKGDAPRPTPRWSLRLEDAVPWPEFLASTMSGPIAERFSEWTYLFLNRRVTGFSFDRDALYVYLRA